MSETYELNLDLNLLRVFVVVAEAGSVTQAAARLYLTQPAVSAALRRLTDALDAPLFVRQGRGLSLTHRGERLLATVRPHLRALAEAARAPAVFDPATSDRTLRLGLADGTEGWLLPPLRQMLSREAPRMRLVVLAVQFRTVLEALASRAVDAAVTVADEMPAGIRRETLLHGHFVCLFDPRHARLDDPPTEAQYFAQDHVVVSYNGDLRGIVEDATRRERRVRCSLPSFASVGAVVDGGALVATVPALVAEQVCATRPHLRAAPLPVGLEGAAIELLWPQAADDDEAVRFLRARIGAVARARGGATPV